MSSRAGYPPRGIEDGAALLEAVHRMGLEAVVAKHRDAAHRAGRRPTA